MNAPAIRAAAALADMPPRAQMSPGSGVRTAEVVSALRANKVPLVEISKHLEAARPTGSAPWHAWHVWQEALRREMGEEHDLRVEVERVLDLLARGGITSVLFKSCGGIPYRSSNVDLLVSPGRMDEAARLLETDGHLRFPHYREDRKVLFRRFRHGRSPAGRIADVGATVCNLAANRLRLRCRPAAVVSLSRIDGSGKSAAIRALREAMVLCEIPTRVVWSRGGFTLGMQAVKKAARTALPAGIPGPGQSAAKARLLSGRVAGTLFAAAVVVEQAMHYLIRVRLPRRAGLSILCDRSGIDTAVDLLAKLSPDRLVARRGDG